MATPLEDLYRADFYAWARAQAAALRGLDQARWNGPLDVENLAEEVDDLAGALRRAALSQAGRLIEHLLKLEYSSASEPRRQWILSVDEAREALAVDLTSTLRRELEDALPDLYRRRRKLTARALTLDDEPDAAASLPAELPWTLDQLLDEDWLPTNRHGLVERV